MSASRAQGWSPVYRAVKRIPSGEVSTYGEIAELAGMPRAARQVGWALHALSEDDDVPWHRVINAQGRISGRGDPEYGELQRALLEAEGIEFDRHGRVDLDRYRWKPRRRPVKKAAKGRGTRRASKKES